MHIKTNFFSLALLIVALIFNAASSATEISGEDQWKKVDDYSSVPSRVRKKNNLFVPDYVELGKVGNSQAYRMYSKRSKDSSGHCSYLTLTVKFSWWNATIDNQGNSTDYWRYFSPTGDCEKAKYVVVDRVSDNIAAIIIQNFVAFSKNKSFLIAAYDENPDDPISAEWFVKLSKILESSDVYMISKDDENYAKSQDATYEITLTPTGDVTNGFIVVINKQGELKILSELVGII